MLTDMRRDAIFPASLLTNENTNLSSPAVLFFAVFAPVHLIFLISQDEDMIQLLFDGGDASGVLAPDNVFDLFGELQFFFLHDLSVFDNIDSDIMVDKSEDIQIHKINGAFDFDNIFPSELGAFCVFYDRHAAVEFIQLQQIINTHTGARLNMVDYNTGFEAVNI